ncbi:MAG: ABC transporter substrate-binding protein [Dehalococcoidia bacterium]
MNTRVPNRRAISRRSVVRGSLLGVAGLAGASLLGCGDEDESAGATNGSGSTGGTSTSTDGSMSAPTGEPQAGGIYRNGVRGDPPSLDPYATGSSDTKTAAGYVYNRLMRIDAQPGENPFDRELVTDLAESIETEDGQRWVVKLRQDAKFHNVPPVDGRAMTMDDVMFSYQRLAAPESVNAAAVEEVASVEAADDYTIVFNLDAPSPIFPERLADGNNLWIQPVEADGGFDPAVTQIGTGPFILQDYQVSSKMTYLRNPDYFESGIPYLDGVDVLIIPEYANAKAQMQAGNIDSLVVAADDVIELREAHADWYWQDALTGGVRHLYFSSEENSPGAPWLDERYRRAISMAMDRDAQMEVGYNVSALQAAGLPASTAWQNLVSVTLGRWWLDPQSSEHGESGSYFALNMDESRKLLDAVGAIGTDLPFITIAGDRYGVRYRRISEMSTQAWTDLGLNVIQQPEDYDAVYFPQTRAGEFHGLAFGGAPAYPDPSGTVDRHFGPTNSNASKVRDPEIEELRQAQALEFDRETRISIFHDIQRLNAEMMYYVPTQDNAGTSYTAYQGNVRDVRLTRGYGSVNEVIARLWLANA